MVTSIASLPARPFDKATAPRPLDSRRAPAFTRESAGASGRPIATATRAYGGPEARHLSSAGTGRQTPAAAGSRDRTPGVLGDIASQTWNSGKEFAGASAQWAAHHAANPSQPMNALTDLVFMGAVGAVLGPVVGAALPFEDTNEMLRGLVSGCVAWGGMNALAGPSHIVREIMEEFAPAPVPANPPPVAQAGAPAVHPAQAYIAG